MLIAIVLIAMAAGVSGGVAYYQFVLPHVRLTSWEIVLVDGKPALKVAFKTNVYPVTVRLIGPDKKTVVDEARAEIPDDIPVILYLPTIDNNAVPGTYYIRIIYKDKVVLYESVDVKLDLKIENVAFCTDYFPKTISYPGGWYITGVNMTVKNTGNSPVRITNVRIVVNGREGRFRLRQTAILKPGSEAFLSAKVSDQESAVYLGGASTYEVEALLDLGPRTISHRAKIRTPAPSLELQDLGLGVYFDVYAGKWCLNNVTLIIRNTGTWTIYVYAIEVDVIELQASESHRFLSPITIEPGEIKIVYADLYIWVSQPGRYNVTISLDLSPDSWLHKTALEIKAPQLVVKDVSFELTNYWGDWWIEGVYVTVENVGDVTGYVLRIYVTVEGKGEDYDTVYTAVKPGETKTIFAIISIDLGSPGTYNVTVKVDLGFTTITYETTLTVG